MMTKINNLVDVSEIQPMKNINDLRDVSKIQSMKNINDLRNVRKIQSDNEESSCSPESCNSFEPNTGKL